MYMMYSIATVPTSKLHLKFTEQFARHMDSYQHVFLGFMATRLTGYFPLLYAVMVQIFVIGNCVGSNKKSS